MTQTFSTPQTAADSVPSPLTPDQTRQYDRDGYLILRGLFAPDRLAAAAAEADGLLRRTELIHTDNLRCRWSTHAQSGECIFETFDPVADLSPACGQLATDPRLLAALSALYGEQACLFKDKLIFKPPGCKGYGLHQDFIAWPHFPRSFLTAIVPLDPATATNGCTEVFTGYHKNGCLSAEDGDYHELSLDLVDPSRAVPLLLDVGDVGIFGGFTPHRSAPNTTAGYRRQLYLSYNAFSDGGPQRDRHYAEFIPWLKEKYAQYGRTGVYFR
jgi:ectoine hydroxylase-related dioxygenase (phytanoyl-CoA dioxygenase family)